MLNSFTLLLKHIMLLLSNQIVQICDDVFELQGNAASVDLNNKGATVACFAWVTLQALHCMAGYRLDKFRHHQVINGTVVHFLTCHSTIRLKSTCDALQTKMKALESDSTRKVTLNIFNKLDSKMSNILHLNPSLKTWE
jgi:hypothetical protein